LRCPLFPRRLSHLIAAVRSPLFLAAPFGSPVLWLRARHIIRRHLPPIFAAFRLTCFILSSPPWPLVLPHGYSPAASRLLSHFTFSCTAYRSIISRNRSTRTVSHFLVLSRAAVGILAFRLKQPTDFTWWWLQLS